MCHIEETIVSIHFKLRYSWSLLVNAMGEQNKCHCLNINFCFYNFTMVVCRSPMFVESHVGRVPRLSQSYVGQSHVCRDPRWSVPRLSQYPFTRVRLVDCPTLPLRKERKINSNFQSEKFLTKKFSLLTTRGYKTFSQTKSTNCSSYIIAVNQSAFPC